MAERITKSGQLKQLRSSLEVVELENAYLRKKVEQLEQELEWAKKEARELK